MAAVEQSLFSSRQTRRIWLERMIIPRFKRKSDGRVVRSTSHIKHLLKVIESHAKDGGQFRMTVSQIAHELGLTERTAYRVISDSKQLGLLTVQPLKGDFSTYEIQWSAVAQVILDCPETTWIIDRNPNNRTPDNCAGTPDNKTNTPDKYARTPDKYARTSGDCTSYSRVRALRPCIDHDLNHVIKPSSDDAKVLKVMGEGKFSGWPKPIYVEDLKKPLTLQTLWDHASSRSWGLTREHRVKFFTLAKWVTDQVAAGQVQNPGGKFTAQLKQSIETGIWPGFEQHEKAAREAIRMLDEHKRYQAAGVRR